MYVHVQSPTVCVINTPPLFVRFRLHSAHIHISIEHCLAALQWLPSNDSCSSDHDHCLKSPLHANNICWKSWWLKITGLFILRRYHEIYPMYKTGVETATSKHSEERRESWAVCSFSFCTCLLGIMKPKMKLTL